MGSGGGGGVKLESPFEGDFWQDPLGNTLNFMTQIGTGGMAGYNAKDGKFSGGSQLRAIDEGLGEVTGRNMQRELANKAEQRILEEEKQREKDLAAQRALAEKQDRNASMSAAAIRSSAKTQNKKDYALGGPVEQDYLGI